MNKNFMHIKQNTLFVIMGIWLLFSIAIYFLVNGMDLSMITRLLVLGYFLISLFWFYKKGQFMEVKNLKRTFIFWCTVNAMVIEIFHMISKPLNDSLLVTSSTPFLQILKNTSIDLVLTLPAYLVIFLIMWYLIKRYHYSIFSFFFLMGLGQALGDGNTFFILNPGALILIPYVMLNYWAMNFVPYLVIRKSLPNTSLQNNGWEKYALPIILLPITYFAVAAVILTVGGALGWIPAP